MKPSKYMKQCKKCRNMKKTTIHLKTQLDLYIYNMQRQRPSYWCEFIGVVRLTLHTFSRGIKVAGLKICETLQISANICAGSQQQTHLKTLETYTKIKIVSHGKIFRLLYWRCSSEEFPNNKNFCNICHRKCFDKVSGVRSIFKSSMYYFPNTHRSAASNNEVQCSYPSLLLSVCRWKVAAAILLQNFEKERCLIKIC